MQESKKRLPKALSPTDLLRMDIACIPFEGAFGEAFGQPARTGTWIIWGESGSGKTSFALMLARELSKYGKVAYNSLEQGASLTMQQAFKRHKLNDLPKGRFGLIKDNMQTLDVRLSRKHAPDFVIIDSLQYTGFRYKDYKEFKEEHPEKLIIYVSHAKAGKPDGSVATKVMYDAELKVLVEGYRAVSKGRTFGERLDSYYTVWEEGAARYWLEKEKQQIKPENNYDRRSVQEGAKH